MKLFGSDISRFEMLGDRDSLVGDRGGVVEPLKTKG